MPESAASNAPSRRAVMLVVVVAALGYFVDIFDLLLFALVRVRSLKDVLYPLIEAAKDPAQRFVALRALQLIHTAESVDGLIGLTKTGDDALRAGAIGALARLYHVEKPWNYKDWWSTRPDDRGPYF